jgi:hypothetical protein
LNIDDEDDSEPEVDLGYVRAKVNCIGVHGTSKKRFALSGVFRALRPS